MSFLMIHSFVGMVFINIQVTKLFNKNSGPVLVKSNHLSNVRYNWFII